MAKFPAHQPRSRQPSQPALSYEHVENSTKDFEVRRDLGNRVTPVNRGHPGHPGQPGSSGEALNLLLFLPFSLPSPSSDLKLPIELPSNIIYPVTVHDNMFDALSSTESPAGVQYPPASYEQALSFCLTPYDTGLGCEGEDVKTHLGGDRKYASKSPGISNVVIREYHTHFFISAPIS